MPVVVTSQLMIDTISIESISVILYASIIIIVI